MNYYGDPYTFYDSTNDISLRTSWEAFGARPYQVDCTKNDWPCANIASNPTLPFRPYVNSRYSGSFDVAPTEFGLYDAFAPRSGDYVEKNVCGGQEVWTYKGHSTSTGSWNSATKAAIPTCTTLKVIEFLKLRVATQI